MTREHAVRALARLVMICGAKKHGIRVLLGPRTDETEQVQSTRPGKAVSLDAPVFPGESGRSDPYRLLHALAILHRNEKGGR